MFVIRLFNYLTNHIVNRIPSFAFRRAWYRRILGIEFGERSGVYLGCYFWHYSLGQIRRSRIRIGSYSRINRNCTLDLRGGLEIGDNVSISPEVVVLTAEKRFGVTRRGRVVIDDHAFIGTRAMVLPGVTLGRGCVVAAGAVVTRDVRPLTVVAGVPAREISDRPEETLGSPSAESFPLFE